MTKTPKIYLAPKTFSRDIVLFEGIQVLGGVVMGMLIEARARERGIDVQ